MFALKVSAQDEASVKSFTLTNDHVSSADRRKDFNGNLCALVKVQVVDEIQRVEGNKIGKIENRGVEKWIYMCKDSRNMKLHLKNHLPIRVVFQDYKINGLESNRVYELIIDTPSPENKAKEMQTLIINYTPIDATVVIDSKSLKGNGRIETKLPVGEHKYSISAFGYVTVESEVKLNNLAPRVITETLVPESTTSTSNSNTTNNTGNIVSLNNSVTVGVDGNLLTLKISPFYAKIKIDGKAYEADEEGELSVPVVYGQHLVEVEADGYSPNKTSVLVKKSGVSKKIKLSELKEKTSKGVVKVNEDNGVIVGKTGNLLTINLKYIEGLRMTLDNENVPLNTSLKKNTLVFTLPYGTHECKVECDGYETEYFSVNIGKNKVTKTVSLSKIDEKKAKKGAVVSSASEGVVIGQNGNEVSFTVNPTWATIIIDEEKLIPNFKGQVCKVLQYGIHKVSVEANGFERKSFTVNVEKSKISEKIKLKKITKMKQ